MLENPLIIEARAIVAGLSRGANKLHTRDADAPAIARLVALSQQARAAHTLGAFIDAIGVGRTTLHSWARGLRRRSKPWPALLAALGGEPASTLSTHPHAVRCRAWRARRKTLTQPQVEQVQAEVTHVAA